MEFERPVDECDTVVRRARWLLGKGAYSCRFVRGSIRGCVGLKAEYFKGRDAFRGKWKWVGLGQAGRLEIVRVKIGL
jgi:hypothetical protein